MSTIYVSLDGGLSWIAAPEGVRVLYKDQLEVREAPANLLVNCTGEGIILDVIDEDGTEVKTAALDFDKLEDLTQ